VTKLAVVNESKRVTDADVKRMVAAIRTQARQAAKLIDRHVPASASSAVCPSARCRC
jgi:hypothetical protein